MKRKNKSSQIVEKNREKLKFEKSWSGRENSKINTKEDGSKKGLSVDMLNVRDLILANKRWNLQKWNKLGVARSEGEEWEKWVKIVKQ